MEITLPGKLESFVNAQVRAGKYVDAQEVVRDALRRMQELEAPDPSLVREAMNLAAQAQRDVLGLMQRADTGEVRVARLIAHPNVCRVYDIARKIPVARCREGRARFARTGHERRRTRRAGSEADAPRPRGDRRALGALGAVLERGVPAPMRSTEWEP
jgi:putative addiction module CopG family antidote